MLISFDSTGSNRSLFKLSSTLVVSIESIDNEVAWIDVVEDVFGFVWNLANFVGEGHGRGEVPVLVLIVTPIFPDSFKT